ncbi:MAG: type II toxin-antitoxin system VapC family toxin [Armatimonadetes bacterium]|nr:type II toxin-antitoxin system VapC family toxin [Armatimonadota bacterium]
MIAPAGGYPVVVDASVGVKWVVSEEHSLESIALFDERLHLIVPDLFYLEAGNTLGKKADRGEITPQKARDLYQELFDTPLDVQPSLPLAQRSLEWAVDSRRSLYDSIYLTLALSAGGKYATADVKYVNGLLQTRPDLASALLWVADIPRWLPSLPSTPL